MKKSSYISGVISLCIVLIATIFKASHFPGANILLLLGMGSMSLIFLPISYLQLLKTTNDMLLKWVYHLAFISFFVDFIGMTFKILHWPGASILLLVGIPLPFVLFLPMYITYHNKRNLKTDVSFSAILLFMIYLGVFSSFLALSPAKTVINASTKLAENIEKANLSFSDVLGDQPKSLNLVNNLELIKMAIAVETNENNKNMVADGKLVNFEGIFGKDQKINYTIYKNAGLLEFETEFSNFKNNITLTNTSKLVDQLFAEIDVDLVPKGNNDFPAIVNISLINALNIISDWQNKIMLIEYFASL